MFGIRVAMLNSEESCVFWKCCLYTVSSGDSFAYSYAQFVIKTENSGFKMPRENPAANRLRQSFDARLSANGEGCTTWFFTKIRNNCVQESSVREALKC